MTASNPAEATERHLARWRWAQRNIDLELKPLRVFSNTFSGPVVFVVMDGIAIGDPQDPYNAVARASTPTLDWLAKHAKYTTLLAHGTHVGLPTDKDIGNSEVGHNIIGAGRWTPQGAVLINTAIENGTFFESAVLNDSVLHVLKRQAEGSSLHLMGLLQRHRSVHSHTDHLKAILGYAAKKGVKRIFVHGLIDGRDDPEGSAPETIADLERHFAEISREYGIDVRFASGGGRMAITMDRNLEDPAMVERGWNVHVHGEGRRFASFSEAIATLKAETGAQDQFLPPFVIAKDGQPVGRINDGDAVFWFNYRPDRSLEISRAFEEQDFNLFNRGPRPDVLFGGIIAYDMDAGIPARYIVEPPPVPGTISEILALAHIPQMAITEGQKFSHLTLFWRGNRSSPFDSHLETDLKISSDPTHMFATHPWMKAAEITNLAIQSLREGSARFVRINYANGDMVGHTGSLEAAMVAVSSVDLSLGRLLAEVKRLNGVAIVTADHGNADVMVERKNGIIKLDAKGDPIPRIGHTTNPVPCYIYAPSFRAGSFSLNSVRHRTLANLAATTLNFLGFQTPAHMNPSLVRFA